MRFVWGQPLIRALTVVTAIGNLATSAVLAVLVYRARIELHAGPIQTGIVLAGAAVGQFLATPLAEATARRLPPGRNMLLATILQPIFPLALALTGQIGAMAGIAICWGAAVTLLNIPSITLRRALIPDHLLSRTASAIRLIAWSGVPLGALFGGLIAGDYGARVTFACAAAALALGIAYVVVSPIPRADTPHSRG